MPLRWRLVGTAFVFSILVPCLAQNVTGRPTDLTPDSVTQDSHARLSADASAVTFTGLNRPTLDGTQSFYSDVLVMRADGANRKRVRYPNDAMTTEWSSLSPDGNKVAFHSWNTAGTTDIWIADLLSGDAKQLTTTASAPTFNSFPTWSPDGSSVAFLSKRPSGADYQVWVMKAQPEDPITNRPVQVTNWTNAAATGLQWAPDGRLLLVKDANGVFDVFRVNADGTGLARLTAIGIDISDPSQAVAGGRIFFRRLAEDERYHVFSVKDDGSDLHQVTGGDFDEDTPCAAGDKLVVSVLDPLNGLNNYDVAVYSLSASDASGTISGTLTVGSGQPAEGAKVSFFDGAILRGTATTDASGRYSATLPPGGYTARFEMTGMSTVVRGAIVAPAGSTALNAATSDPRCVAPVSVIPTIKGDSVSVRWTPAQAPDDGGSFGVIGYNVYRSTAENGPWTRISPNPIAGSGALEFADSSPGDLASALYAVTTLISDGTAIFESSFSAAAQAANNLIFNPSFELDSGDAAHTPRGWVFGAWGADGCTWGTDTIQSRDGLRAAFVQAGPADSATGDVVPGTALLLSDMDHLPAVKPGEAMVEAVFARYASNPSFTRAYLKTAFAVDDPPTAFDWTPWDGSYDSAPLEGGGMGRPDSGWTLLTNPNVLRSYEFQNRTRISMLWDIDEMTTPTTSRVYYDEVRYQVRRIGPTGIVMGRIVDALFRPITGVTLTASGRSTITDPYTGSFVLRDLPTGPVDVTVSMPGRADDVIHVLNYGGFTLPDDYAALDLGSLPLVVRGSVRFPNGTAAPGATVKLQIGHSGRERTVITDAEGVFSFGSTADDISSSEFSTLTASKPGWIAASVTGGFGLAGWSVHDLYLVTPAAGDINADGAVTPADAAIALKFAAGLDSVGDRLAPADVSPAFGTINLADATTIARMASGIGR